MGLCRMQRNRRRRRRHQRSCLPQSHATIQLPSCFQPRLGIPMSQACLGNHFRAFITKLFFNEHLSSTNRRQRQQQPWSRLRVQVSYNTLKLPLGREYKPECLGMSYNKGCFIRMFGY